jgi:NAD(P)-dependent dehydrogenase (short-subunit alcohol dehydrogenase family)
VTAQVAVCSPSLGEGVPLGEDVRLLPAPDRLRARLSPEGFRTAMRDATEVAIADLRRHGCGVAALLADCTFSSDGLHPEDVDWLADAADAVHRAGGVYIADEVQAGFGRLGAARNGDRIRAELAGATAGFEQVAQIRGEGLYIGVDLVEDADTLAPATGLAEEVVNRLRERHVLNLCRGPRGNGLKIRPPLVFTDADVDRLLTETTATPDELASLPGLRVRNERIACSEAKHAVVALGNTLRREGWDDGVRVCTVCPGFVRTDMAADTTKAPRAEMTAPEDLAHLARTVMELPNTASVARLAVNCRFEDEY